jgi:hypothetical protein
MLPRADEHVPLISPKESGRALIAARYLRLPVKAHTNPELSRWLNWASESGITRMFASTVAEAARMAGSPDYVLLRPVSLELKRRYPED